MPLNIDFQQILLHMFNVVLLFGILYLLLYKPVKDFMDKRVKEYADMDAEAKEALGKAKQEQETYEQKLQSVYKEIAQLRETAVKERETEVAQILESANAQAASILAKVSRDRYMYELAEAYPQYEFEKHKGYGTRLHYEKLREFGPSPVHRMSFLKKMH